MKYQEIYRKFMNEANKVTGDKMGQYAILAYAAYVAVPAEDMTKSYKALIDSNHVLFKRLKSKIKVDFVDDYEEDGYDDKNSMVAGIKKNKELRVDTRHSDNNPYFSPEENWIFRAVHDYYTHNLRGKDYKDGYGFNLKGELQTYNTHSKLAPDAALPALFSEVVCQVSYEIVTGSFPDPQKSAIVRGFDFKNVGVIAFEGQGQSLQMGVGVYEDNFPAGVEESLSKIGHGALEAYKALRGKN